MAARAAAPVRAAGGGGVPGQEGQAGGVQRLQGGTQEVRLGRHRGLQVITGESLKIFKTL